MKPIKLTICGINSYTSPQTIDFKLLSSNSIFGIFGQTGSGKSTILDSIILALYGSSDRDNLTGIINVNMRDAFVDFEFEIDQEKTTCYRVVRTFRARPSGFKSGAELTDLTNNINLGDTPEKVNLNLQKIIGIAKKEFVKCIALPQNEFDKFITDTPQDRKRSIAKLFNLENFGDNLNEKVKDRISVLNVKKSSLQEQLNAFGYVTKESQKQLSIKLNSLQKELGLCLKQSDKLKNDLSSIRVKYDKSKQFYAAKLILDDINSQSNDYIRLQSELEYFKSNKENIEIYNQIKDKLISISNNTENIKTINLTLDKLTEKVNKLNSNLNDVKTKLEIEKLAYNNFKVELEKNKIILLEIEKLNNKILKLNEDKNYLLDEYESNSLQAKQYNSLILACEKKCEQLKTEVKNLTDVNNKIEDIFSFSEAEVFIKNLNEIKACFNQTNIDEVEHYRAYRDFTKAVSKINRYIFDYNQKLLIREDILKQLETPINKVKQLNKQVDANLISKEKKLTDEEARLQDLKETAIKIEYEAKNILKRLNDTKKDINESNLFLKEYKQNLKENKLKDNSDEINKLEQKLAELTNLVNNANLSINNYKTETNALLVSNKFLTDEVNELKQKLPANFEPELLVGNITDKNFLENENKLNEFLRNKSYYQTLIENLTEELGGNFIDQKLLEETTIKFEELTKVINNLRVEVGITGSTLEANEKILNKNTKFIAELEEVNKNLEIVLKLQAYIAKNALVDFVAEEYLYLITEYSNKFVNRISRGKYLLSYNSETSEFMAIDNFNGGFTRSIKTLSGGERFIFSLSLALGVSQSIAVSNDKNFNFFFIDEGFGNLSEDYIDDVLQCFESLTRLNFVVGFITHVDKMQEYITNKVVVTKDNNESGSVIKQY